MTTLPHSTKGGASELIRSWEGSIFCRSNGEFDKTNQKQFKFKRNRGKVNKTTLSSSFELKARLQKSKNLKVESIDMKSSEGSKYKRFLDINKKSGVYMSH